jgi:hypothetical protein
MVIGDSAAVNMYRTDRTLYTSTKSRCCRCSILLGLVQSPGAIFITYNGPESENAENRAKQLSRVRPVYFTFTWAVPARTTEPAGEARVLHFYLGSAWTYRACTNANIQPQANCALTGLVRHAASACMAAAHGAF